MLFKPQLQIGHIRKGDVPLGDVPLFHAPAVERERRAFRHCHGQRARRRRERVHRRQCKIPAPFAVNEPGARQVRAARGNDVFLKRVVPARSGTEGKVVAGHGGVEYVAADLRGILKLAGIHGALGQIQISPVFPAHGIHGVLHHVFGFVLAEHAPRREHHPGRASAQDRGGQQYAQQRKSPFLHCSALLSGP